MSNIWNTYNCILCIRAFVFLESYIPQMTSSRLKISFTCKGVDFFPWPLQDSCLSHLARYLPTTSRQWSRAWFRSPQTIISKSTSGRQAINRRRCNCCWTSSAWAPTCCSLAKFLTMWVRLPSIRCVIVVPLITNNWLPAGDSLPLDRTRRLPPEVTFSTTDFTRSTTGRRAFPFSQTWWQFDLQRLTPFITADLLPGCQSIPPPL